MSQADQLYRLQQIDSEIRDKKKRLGDVLKAQKESEALLAARARSAAADEAHQQWQAHHRALSQELGAVGDKVKVSEESLYSGRIKNTKELSDLQKEIEALGRRRAAVEDQLLEVMVEGEEKQSARATAAEELARLEDGWETSKASLKAEQDTLARRLNELIAQRQQQVSRITPAALRDYEYIVKQHRDGVAVAVLQVNRCLGCQVTVSAEKVRTVREGQLTTCGNCGRILYSKV
jgi:predicted  nucleic acid-binding Zn-ribbon protein